MLIVGPGVDVWARRMALFRVEPVSSNQTSVLDWEIERYRWRQPDCVRQINYSLLEFKTPNTEKLNAPGLSGDFSLIPKPVHFFQCCFIDV